MVKSIVFLILGIVIGLAIFYGLNYFQEIGKMNEIKDNVKKLYELANPGILFSVENIKSEGSMYKVLLKSINEQQPRYIETYVSKDGRFLTEAVIFVKESAEQIEKLKNFVDCLDSKQVRILGMLQSNITEINQATLLQLNILGRYSSKIYFSCDGDNLNTCLQLGITSLPVVFYNNRTYPGIYNIAFLSNLTGCPF